MIIIIKKTVYMLLNDMNKENLSKCNYLSLLKYFRSDIEQDKNLKTEIRSYSMTQFFLVFFYNFS